MTRVKGSTVTHLRHKKVIKYNKGNFGTRHSLFKRANETMLKVCGMPIEIGATASVIFVNYGLRASTQQLEPMDFHTANSFLE